MQRGMCRERTVTPSRLPHSNAASMPERIADTAGSDASILEMARVLQAQQSRLERGVRFAWWPGHSFGRYAGSTWYVDRFWADLDQHCVAYTNLDDCD